MDIMRKQTLQPSATRRQITTEAVVCVISRLQTQSPRSQTHAHTLTPSFLCHPLTPSSRPLFSNANTPFHSCALSSWTKPSPNFPVLTSFILLFFSFTISLCFFLHFFQEQSLYLFHFFNINKVGFKSQDLNKARVQPSIKL